MATSDTLPLAGSDAEGADVGGVTVSLSVGTVEVTWTGWRSAKRLMAASIIPCRAAVCSGVKGASDRSADSSLFY